MNSQIPDPVYSNLPFTVEQFNGMPYRPLGGSGLRVPAVGLGTWKIGYPKSGDGSRIDQAEAFRLFDKAIELGVSFWDTANRYNNASGNSERVIGRWLQEHPGQRRNVVLATKLGGTMDGCTPNHCGLSRINIMESVYASLDRLQVAHIDLLYFHAFDPLTPIDESLAAVEDLVREDLVRYFAVSNFTVAQLKDYAGAAQQMSARCRVVAVQNQFDILQGESTAFPGVRAYAAGQGLSFIAWSPMARGLLTEKYLQGADPQPGDRLFDEGLADVYHRPGVRAVVHQLAALAREWELTLSQLVIAYMLTLPGMGPVIPAASTVEQLTSNAAAAQACLEEDQKRRVQAVLSAAGFAASVPVNDSNRVAAG